MNDAKKLPTAVVNWTVSNPRYRSVWKSTLVTIIIIVVFFIVLGILGQIYLSWPGRASDEQESFERNVEYWIGNQGVIFAMLLFLFLIVAMVMLSVVIKEAKTWKGVLQTRFQQTQMNVDNAFMDITKAANAITTLADTIRVDVVPSVGKVVENKGDTIIKNLTEGGKKVGAQVLSSLLKTQ